MKYRRTERGHYREESPKQGLISAKDLPIELFQKRSVQGENICVKVLTKSKVLANMWNDNNSVLQ